MFPYWLFFAVLAAGAMLSHPQAVQMWRPLFLATVLALILFIGLRFEVGPDWTGYMSIWNWTKRFSLESVLSRGDIGFSALNWFLHRIGAEFWALNLVCAIVFMVGLSAFCLRMPNPWLALCVAFPYLILVLAMSGVRQATASGFFFLALVAFFDRRLIPATLLLIAASMFHASAIAMLGIAALAMTHNRLVGVLVLALTAYLGLFVLHADFETYIDRYSTQSVQSAGVWFRLAMNLVPGVVFLAMQRRFDLPPHVRSLWKIFAYLSLACIPAMGLFPSSTAIDRFSLYLSPIQVFVLSTFPYALTNDRRNAVLAVAATLAYLMLVLLVFLNFSVHRDAWDPYQSYLFSETR